MAFALAVVIVSGMAMPWWYTVIYAVSIMCSLLLGILGVWYAIDGEDLVVYSFFRPHRYPISKIKEVKYVNGILSNPALSVHRISIKFTDRSVLRSSLPLEISPKDREGFVYRLLSMNPEISVV